LGRLAIFFTTTPVSGILRMKYSQFVMWNGRVSPGEAGR
jgi:hypothetical protein